MLSISVLVLLSAVASNVLAQPSNDGIPHLTDQHFTYPNLPFKVDPNQGVRGPQTGYNLCNSTTEGPNSMCQTSFLNSIDDFCLWSAPGPNQIIADTEGETVAWCTKPGHGTKLIPADAITGVQFLRAPAYVQVTGHIDQTKIGLTADDFGGELDPIGADLRGNPLGGLVFSNAFGAKKDNNSFTQVIFWHNFMGGGRFCFKACDPAGADAAHYCEHIFDRIGCDYNAPASYEDNAFTSCDSENQDFPGIFTSNGQVMTYTQPPESLGPINTIPYTPRMPSSSNCQTFSREQLFGSASTSASGTQATGTNGASGTTGSSQGSGTRSGSTPNASSTGGASSRAVVSQFGAVGAALLSLAAML